ncbi:MAG: UDP-N-acetylmuramoyl-L-alanyl-D-glutamate--2,6-diaminopimelate ligase [Bdellovibrionota bacterium]
MSQPIMIKEIAEAINGKLVNYSENLRIDYVSMSSQQIKDSTLFVAIRGFSVDGHNFIDDAFKKGAIAVVCEDESYLHGRVGIVVENARYAFSKIACMHHGNPSSRMFLEGVTGTNGKTTVNWILYHLYTLLNEKALRLGTLGAYSEGFINKEFATGMPDSLTIQGLFEDFVNANGSYGVLEYTSQGGSQYRGDFLEYDSAIFTNLTQDHLDYHETIENYFLAKQRFFDLLLESPKKDKNAIINIDCPYGERLYDYLKESELTLYSYGSKEGADIYIKSFEQDIKGSKLVLSFYDVDYLIESSFIGEFNAHNIAAAFGAFVARTNDPHKFVEIFEFVPPVLGRLEPVSNPHFGIYIDYAHTDDALKNVLQTLRKVVRPDAKLWCVFGCGGDRDRTKRPKMAKVACELADKVVMTMDNPRTEDPNQILSDMLDGCENPDIVELDRKIAIYETLHRMQEGDVVLIAGKGHENYQIIGTEKIPYSDKEAVEEILATM